VTRDRLYNDTMQEIYTNVTKVMVDSRSNSNLLYLPLDKLMQQAGGAPLSLPAATLPAQPAQEAPVSSSANDTIRSRDGQRSRDRDAR
jgi:membrane protease subunit HflK